ncbi:hypothetical protein S245_046989 [Arachis hypogaea]
MTRKHNISGQSILEELRRQSEDINLSSEDGLEQIRLNDDGDEISETEMLNQSGGDLPERAAPKNKRDENEPLLVKVKGYAEVKFPSYTAVKEMQLNSLKNTCTPNSMSGLGIM